MNKQSFYALMSAIALSGAFVFSSCNSSGEIDEAVLNPNPGYDPVTGDVPVQFVMNLAAGSAPSGTRQTAAATQADDNLASNKFRGIEGAHIMCFEQGDAGKFLASPAAATRDFDMSRVATAASLGSENSTRVLEMSLPLRTNTVVFYGRAITDRTKDNYKNEYGYLDAYHVESGAESGLNKTYFQLGRRLTEAGKTQLTQIETMLADVLTCIMETDIGTPDVESTDGTQYGYGYHIVAKDANHEDGIVVYNSNLNNTLNGMHWSAYEFKPAVADRKSPLDVNQPMTQLEEFLARAYFEMTNIQSGEMRNASAPALLSTIKDLWTNINHVRCANPTSVYEAVAKYMAECIHKELNEYFEPSSSELATGGPITSVAFRSISTITGKLVGDSYWPGASKPTADDFGSIGSYALNDLKVFPEKFDLPQGATHIEFNKDTKIFSYLKNFKTGAVGDVTFTVDDYYYPAELLYFGNSPIRVSNKENKAGDYPKTTANWHNSELDFWKTTGDDAWSVEGVKASTRSVAMINDINYGTALLATTVGYKSGVTTLQDNNHAIQDRDFGVNEANNEITPTETSFILKGIVIGGQYPIVGWNYLPKEILSNDSENPTNTNTNNGWIFDKVMASNGAIPASGTSDPTYTLVFDNYNAGGTQDKVYVALELQNNTGKDFYGLHNLIPNGSNFYLVGLLDPTGKSISEWSNYHALPPYNTDGTFNRVPRVFIQDHKTVVNFTIGATSLQSAYLTVPDLRASSVTLGLSVNMEWESGLSFDVEFGGSGSGSGN